MELTSIVQIWKLLKWLPKIVLRRIFTKRRLADLVYIDVKPRGESVRVNINETPSYDIWFQIINLTPFEIELDRAELDLNFSGIGIKNKHVKKCIINSGEIYIFHISDYIDSGRCDVLNRMAKTSNESSIGMYCFFNCSLHSFEKDNIHLGSVNIKYMGIKQDDKSS